MVKVVPLFWLNIIQWINAIICVSDRSAAKPIPNSLAESCCSKNGLYGLSKEFCEKKESLNGASGTTGCHTNCGEIKMVVNPSKTSKFMKIGCYESWNQGWTCLNSDMSELDLTDYTHIHYDFGNFDSNNNVAFDSYASSQNFKKLKEVKKILSLGG
ncbi:hypothetical protein K502DRAFT_346737 [Neoconidiobolus thromboides FSU 785]|nr:hypothetical protein K502DRAFT_346737 [Neoconidiobolus thromboides FSU 785]